MVHRGKVVGKRNWSRQGRNTIAFLAALWLFAGLFSYHYIPYVPWADLYEPTAMAGAGFWGLLLFLLAALKVDGETGWSRMLRYQNDGQSQVVSCLKAAMALMVFSAALGWLTPSVVGMSAYLHAGPSDSVEVREPTVEGPRRTSNAYRIGVTGKFEGEFDWDRHSDGFPSINVPYREHRTVACLHLDYQPGLFGVLIKSVRDCVSPGRAQEGTESAEVRRARLERIWGTVLVGYMVVAMIYKITMGLRTGRLDMFTIGSVQGHVYDRKAERWGFYRGIVILALALIMIISMVLLVNLHRTA